MESRICQLILWVLLAHTTYARVDSYGGWNTSPDTQYHIQTDEGEERYFKYQTLSGQYRKEKRLHDGSVVGTYGWVDPNGYLRLRDYVADNGGYRVVNSKMIYVGQNSDIGSSVSAAKHVPSSVSYPARVDVFNSANYYNKAAPYNEYLPPNKNYLPPPAVKIYPQSAQYLPPSREYLPSTTPASTVPLKLFSYTSTPSPLIYRYHSSTPLVDIYPNALPKFFVSSTPAPPTSTPAIGVYNSLSPTQTPAPISVSSTPRTPVAVKYVSSTEATPLSYVSTPAPYISSTPLIRSHSTTASPISAIGYTASTPAPREILSPIAGKFTNSVNNNFITETRKNQLFFDHERSRFNKRYITSRNNDNDGIYTMQDGFRYFLPRMYHEERSSSSGQERTGSFGYIDPFGIRRVTYYNTSPDRGFVHRKNNRYVGFNAAPYDPRPA